MSIKLLMPALSPTMEEGNLAKWLKKEGDTIKSGDVIAEIETDKATMEFEATDEGVLGKIIVPDGSEGIKVNQVIGILLEDGESLDDIKDIDLSGGGVAPAPAKKEAIVDNVEKKISVVKEQGVKINNTPADKEDRIFATPLARVIAKQNNIDLSGINGSGPRGRIVKADVEVSLSNPSVNMGSSLGINSAKIDSKAPFFEEKNSNMRKVIAKRLLESKQTIPHYYITLQCKMDDLMQVRGKINSLADGKYKISVNDFIIKATGLAMRDVPSANSYWMDDKSRFFNRSDVSVAVATSTGLITPIVKDVVNRGLIEISNDMKDLASRARDGKLKPEEYQGGGFSISNLGMFGVDEFSAIINPPQSGIIAVGASKKIPVVEGNEIKIALVMNITLSADHRVLDGAVGAKFLNVVKNYIENPASMIL